MPFSCNLIRHYFCLGPPEQFDNWLSGFSLEDKKGEISELLVSSPSIRALYTKMVCIVAVCQHLTVMEHSLQFCFQRTDQMRTDFFFLHAQVPAAVAHSEFWQRYFYKVFQLDQVSLLFYSVYCKCKNILMMSSDLSCQLNSSSWLPPAGQF